MKILLGIVLLLGWTNAHAYIDPGTGSAIISTIVGFFVAIGVAVKTYWYKIKGFFSGKKAEEAKPEAAQVAETQGEEGRA